MQCYPKVQCNSKEHVNRNIRKDKNADRKTGMVFWPWATNFRSIAHERRISDTSSSIAVMKLEHLLNHLDKYTLYHYFHLLQCQDLNRHHSPKAPSDLQ